MGRQFSGSGQYYTASTSFGLGTTSPVTFAALVNPDDFSAQGIVCSLGVGASSNQRYLTLSTAGNIGALITSGAAATSLAEVSYGSAGTWRSVVAEYASQTSRKISVEGGTPVENTDSRAITSAPTMFRIGATNSAGGPWDGGIEYVAIYGGVLTDDSRRALALRADPRLVQPGLLLECFFLTGRYASERGIKGTALTVTGAPTFVTPPTLFRPVGRSMVSMAAVAGGTAYELPTEAGAYAVTGSAAGLRASRSLDTSSGAYTTSGSPTDLLRIGQTILTAVPGTYALSGAAVAWRRDYALATTPGTYAIAGASAPLLAAGALPPFVVRQVLTRRMRRSPALVSDARWLFHRVLQIDLETGVGLSEGQGAHPQVMLRWSDDGGETWSHEHWTSAGRLGEFQVRATWLRLGRSRDRIYEATVSDPVAWHLLGALVEIEQGVS